VVLVGISFSPAPLAIDKPGKSYWKGRLGTVDPLILSSLDQQHFTLKILFIFFYKTSYLYEEANSTEPSSSVGIPWTNQYFWRMLKNPITDPDVS
jgi:hypothetical protein